MTNLLRPDSPELRAGLYRLYRDFFDRAEKKRRWSLADDVPWDQCNPAMAPHRGGRGGKGAEAEGEEVRSFAPTRTCPCLPPST